MATAFDDIYNRAIVRFSDYGFLKLKNSDRESILRTFLDSSISDFRDICHTDLSLTDSTGFTEELSGAEQEILSLGVAYYWLCSKILDCELLRDKMSGLDYTFHSGANLLKELRGLREDVRLEYHTKINLYSYRRGDIENLKA